MGDFYRIVNKQQHPFKWDRVWKEIFKQNLDRELLLTRNAIEKRINEQKPTL